MEREGFTAPTKDPAIYVKNSWRVAHVLTFLALGYQLDHFLYSTLVQEPLPQQASGPLRPLGLDRPPASVGLSFVLLLHHTQTYFALSLRTCFPQSPTMGYTVRLTAPRVAIDLGPAHRRRCRCALPD